MNVIGDVSGKECIIVDDIADTAGTLCNAAEALKTEGAVKVSAYIVHPVLSGNAIEKISQSKLDQLVVTDTIPLSKEAQSCNKIRVVTMAPTLSQQVNLNATGRETDGKSSSRRLRRAGSVPAVIYGGDKDPIRISILEKDIAKASEVPGFATQILSVNLSGEEQNVIVKEIQRHPATQRVLHADLLRVNPDTKISLSVPVRFINEEICVGVKMHGGAISRLINNIDINCLASNLPEYLEVDVAELDVGDSVFLSSLDLPEGVEIPSLALGEDRDQAVVSITEAKVLDVEPEVVESADEEGDESSDDSGESSDSSEESAE